MIAPGEMAELAPGLRRLTADNPSPMTGPGTNSYIVGTGPCVIVDPGVDDARHLDMLTAAAPGGIAAILVTHRHPDHTGGVARLAETTGAPVRAWPDAAPTSRHASALTVDRPLADGETITLGAVTLQALHTPGHTADHLCFYLHESRVLLAGDSVMADVTVVIIPPEGRMSDYLASIERLRAIKPATIAPAHGRMLDDPAGELAHIRTHRLEREAQVAAALAADGAHTPAAIAERLYPDLDPRLRPMAAAQVEAHLVRLAELGAATADGSNWRATR